MGYIMDEVVMCGGAGGLHLPICLVFFVRIFEGRLSSTFKYTRVLLSLSLVFDVAFDRLLLVPTHLITFDCSTCFPACVIGKAQAQPQR
jgi:hypothetical protein